MFAQRFQEDRERASCVAVNVSTSNPYTDAADPLWIDLRLPPTDDACSTGALKSWAWANKPRSSTVPEIGVSITLPTIHEVLFQSMISEWTSDANPDEVTFVARKLQLKTPMSLKNRASFTLSAIMESIDGGGDQKPRVKREVCNINGFQRHFETASLCANSNSRPFLVDLIRPREDMFVVNPGPAIPFDLIVKYATNTFSLAVFDHSKVSDLKICLSGLCNVPVEHQRLVCHRGVVLNDNETLADQQITGVTAIDLLEKCDWIPDLRALGDVTVKIVFPKFTTVVVTVPRDVSVCDVLRYASLRREEWKMTLLADEELNCMQRSAADLKRKRVDA